MSLYGTNYLKKGDWDQSVFYFNKALEIDPKYADAYYNRGTVYANKGQYNRAISDFNKVIKIKPRHTLAYYNRQKY